MFLAARKVLRPLLFWDIHYVFHRALGSHAAPSAGDSGTTIRILKSELDLAGAPADLTLLCPGAAERLRNGQVVVMALANSGAAAPPEIAGYTWITFSDIWLPEFDLTMIVRPGEMVHYDSFVSTACRGRGLHTILIVVAKQYGLSTGCTHSLSWISVFNSQSLKTAQRLVREPEKPLIVFSIKLRGMKRFRNLALQGSLASRFQRKRPALSR